MKCEYYKCKSLADVTLLAEIRTSVQSLSGCADHANESMLGMDHSIHKIFYFEEDWIAYDVAKALL